MRKFVVLGTVLTLSALTTAQAQAPSLPLPPDQIIAMRQSMMDLQQGVAAAMKATVEAKSDVKAMQAGAEGLLSSSKLIPAMFPVGTEKGHDTKAKSEIWSDWAGFEKASAKMTTETEKLVKLAEANDIAGFATQFRAVGQTCGGCHREFKMKD